jgi:hypothetical protein
MINKYIKFIIKNQIANYNFLNNNIYILKLLNLILNEEVKKWILER